MRPHLPSSADGWRAALAATRRDHRPAAQRAMIAADPAADAARWLEALSDRLWRDAPVADAA
ncbi:hypothetical protein [Sphingomonas sp. RIT328]|uniref:hypothetical protein n=1 Tax=Sphingomonas sp. RIT328 TaxID=1470591 RepID=UPI001F42130B|nr:hypothetical protein [Sphingomonas sp. RIT328]